MSINTYAELKAAIADFLARDDLTNQIPTFIQLAEARLSRTLETRSQERRARATFPANDEFISLPTDLRALRSLRLPGSPTRTLEYKTPEDLFSQYSNTLKGTPQAYTVIGCEIAIRPVQASETEVELIYGEDIASLASGSESGTNTILSRHPDAYLYGALAQAYIFLQDEAKAQFYDQALGRSIEEIRDDTNKSRYGAGHIAVTSNYGA